MTTVSKEWITIDKGVYIQYIKEGDGPSLNDNRIGTIVKCSFKLFMFLDADGKKDTDKREGKWVELETRVLESFQLGEADLVKGIELVFLKGDNLKVGDKFRARIESQLCYGDRGRPSIQLSTLIQAIPPNTDLEYMIEIADISTPFPYPNTFSIDNNTGKLALIKANVSSKDVDIDSISEAGVIAYINLRKESGNRWFKFQNFDLSASAYSKGAAIADGYIKLKEGKDIDIKKIKELYIACLNNLAACHISRGNMIRAKAETKKVLELDPHNVKALLRTARASLAIQDWDDCQNCLETIMSSQSPNNEWYEFAVTEMRRLEKAKEKFSADVSPEAKVIKAALGLVRNSSPKTPIETLSPDVSAKLKISMKKNRSYLTFYIKWISFAIILFCSALICHVLFFDKEGMTIDELIAFVKDCIKSVKSLRIEDVQYGIQKSIVIIKSITMNDIQDKANSITSSIYDTVKSINMETTNQKLIEFKASLLDAHINIAKLSETYIKDLKNIDSDKLKLALSHTVKQVSEGSKLAIEYFHNEGIKALSKATGKKIVEESTAVIDVPISAIEKTAIFGKKVVNDKPTVALLFTSILLAVGKNLRF